jgi:peptidoglycan/xylan/chitin deacetylase (PgdA/CDA1 family)
VALNPKKIALARLMGGLGLSALSVFTQTRFKQHIRAVYYHDVQPSTVASFEAQVRYYAQRYHPVGLDDLRGLLDGHWPHDRPGLIISFDDGLRGQAELAAPILARYGFVGWFFVPGGFVSCPADGQQAYAAAHQIDTDAGQWPDARVAMTWAQVRALDQTHVVGCHTWHHVRQTDTLSAAQVQAEISEAKARLEAELGHDVASFGWVGGEEYAYSAASAAAVRDAGFEFAFMTNSAVIHRRSNPLQLHRSHVEASFSMDLMRFQLSGVMDALYLPQRRRVVTLTR